MVRAMIDGRKTQTRRVIKLPTKGEYVHPKMGGWTATEIGGGGAFYIGDDGQRVPALEMVGIWNQTTGTCIAAPYAVGDRLWVKETWAVASIFTDCADVRYRASESRGHTEFVEQIPIAKVPSSAAVTWPKWKSSLFMPRAYSRLTLTVTDVRVERLQAISEADAIAEGIERIDDPRGVAWRSYETCPDGTPHPHATVPNASPVTSYRELWNAINGAGAWDANPWVTVISFDVARGNIDQVPA